MDLLWPDLGAKSAANNLYRAIHVARRTLDPAPATDTSRLLVLHAGSLALCPDGDLCLDLGGPSPDGRYTDAIHVDDGAFKTMAVQDSGGVTQIGTSDTRSYHCAYQLVR